MSISPARQTNLICTKVIDEVLMGGEISKEDFKNLTDLDKCITFIKTRVYYGYGLYILQQEKERGENYIDWLESNTHLKEHKIRKCKALATAILARLDLQQNLLRIILFPMSLILTTPANETLSKKPRKLPESKNSKKDSVEEEPKDQEESHPEPDQITSVDVTQQKLDVIEKALEVENARVQEPEQVLEESEIEKPEPDKKEEKVKGTWVLIPDLPTAEDPEKCEAWVQELTQILTHTLMEGFHKVKDHKQITKLYGILFAEFVNYEKSLKPIKKSTKEQTMPKLTQGQKDRNEWKALTYDPSKEDWETSCQLEDDASEEHEGVPFGPNIQVKEDDFLDFDFDAPIKKAR